MNKKGEVFAGLWFIIGIILTTLGYIVMSPLIETTVSVGQNLSAEGLMGNNSDLFDNLIIVIETIWYKLVFWIIIVVQVVALIITSVKGRAEQNPYA